MKTNQILLGVFIILFCVSNNAFSDPVITSISGQVTDSSSITISGSVFGIHADHSPAESYLPAAWTDFESGYVGYDVWNRWGPGPEFVSDSQRTNSTNCARGGGDYRTYTNLFGEVIENELPRSFYNPNSADSQVLFMSGWFMFPAGSYYTLLHNVAEQCKFISSLATEGGNQYWSISGWQGDTIAEVKMNFEDRRGAGGYGNELKMYAATGNDVVNENEWHRYDVAIDTTKGYGLKESRLYVDGKEYTTDYNRYFREDCDPCPRHFTGSFFIRYIRNAGWYQYFDDAFVNNTWARVEISENSTWDETKRYHKELQIPTSWSDNSITITVNQGSFANGETAYLFVVDADGDVNSQGYPITIGGGTSPTDNKPSVTISSPVSIDSYATSEETVALAGSCSDDNGITTITWANSRGGQGTAYNDSGDWTSWSIPNISLQEGANIITVTAEDGSGNTGSDLITVNYTIPSNDTTPPTIQITSPTSDPTYDTTSSTISLAGTANDNVQVSHVTWSNTKGGSGTASGTTDWTTGAIALVEGENVITITAEDSSGNTQNDSITVNYTIPQGTYIETFGDVPGSDHPATLQDTFNNANPANQNYSTSTTGLNTYTWPPQTSANTIILKCDLRSIPSNAVITDAKLYLYQFESGGDDNYEISVHKIINHNPEVSDCNWDTFDGANSWTGGSNGGLQDIADLEDVNQVSLTNNEYKVWSVTGMVQGWVLNPATNFGMLLSSDQTENKASVSSHRSFIPTENADENKRPKLVVTCTVGGDTTPPGDVSGFTATSGPGQITLTWTNPTDTDFAGVMIRYRTDGTNPQDKDDGSPIPNGNDGRIAGSPGQGMSYVHTNLDPTKHYYYSAFSYDTSNNYSQTAYADAQPLSLNNAPVIQSFTGVPSSLNNPGETTTFNVSATDPDGDSLTYTISFGDGTANGSGSHVVHTYEAGAGEPPHIYTATVTVSDGHGHSVGQSLQVTVNDIPPAEPTNVSSN